MKQRGGKRRGVSRIRYREEEWTRDETKIEGEREGERDSESAAGA